MTDVAPTTDRIQPTVADDPLLTIPSTGGASPKTIYVKPIVVAGVTKAGFALTSTALTWPTGGVQWQFSADDVKYGLFINFVLLTGVEELSIKDDAPAFWFSDLWTPLAGQQAQQSCMPIVASVTTTYHFLAKFPGGGSIDPKIVVTPIPGMPGGPT